MGERENETLRNSIGAAITATLTYIFIDSWKRLFGKPKRRQNRRKGI